MILHRYWPHCFMAWTVDHDNVANVYHAVDLLMSKGFEHITCEEMIDENDDAAPLYYRFRAWMPNADRQDYSIFELTED